MGKAVTTSMHHDHSIIRSKLLNRLGIFADTSYAHRSSISSSKALPIRNHADSSRRKHVFSHRSIGSGSSRSTIGNVVPFQQPLNDSGSQNNDCDGVTATTTSCNWKSPRENRCIRFDSNVQVVTIPHHDEYSSRIKKFLWAGCDEIQENAERNRIEFAAEGWDWHTVLEDDEMFVDASTGELVHPCWFEDDADNPTSPEVIMVDAEFRNPSERPSLTRSSSFCMNLQELSE